MSWERDVFATLDDLEQQAAAVFDAERDAEVADRARSAYAEVTLASRVMASLGGEVAMDVRGVGTLRGTLQRVGPDWCLLRVAGRDWLLRLAAVTALRGASARAVPEVAWSPVARLRLGAALRRVSETGQGCLVHQVDGGRWEVTVGRVGQDFVEGRTADGSTVLVALAGLAAVQGPGEAGG